MTGPTLPAEAHTLGEWSSMALTHLQAVIDLTQKLAQAKMHNVILTHRIAQADGAGSPYCEVTQAEAGDLIEREQCRAERDDWHRIAVDWKEQFEASDASCVKLSADWEAQGVRIMELERELAALRGSEEPPAPAKVPIDFAKKTKPCFKCRMSFEGRGAQKYCDDCRAKRQEAK